MDEHSARLQAEASESVGRGSRVGRARLPNSQRVFSGTMAVRITSLATRKRGRAGPRMWPRSKGSNHVNLHQHALGDGTTARQPPGTARQRWGAPTYPAKLL